MPMPTVLDFPRIELQLGTTGTPGERVLAGILAMASTALERLHAECRRRGCTRLAAVGRLRGTGRGIHFRDLVGALEAERPLKLVSPFENSERVAGAVWTTAVPAGTTGPAALAKLRWSAGADDLPMHVHDLSDRVIVVDKGRGYFHVSGQPAEEFDGTSVRTIPARERDVFIFTRGIAHTFSTLHEPLDLLSVQSPFLAFDDPRQYRLPKHVWKARDNPEATEPKVGCDPAWTVLAGCCGG